MKNKIITIDGTAGSGKERIARYICRTWKMSHIDTGIIYRRIAFLIIKKKINIKNFKKVKKLLSSIKVLSLRRHRCLRTEDVSMIASKIAVYKFIRIYVNNYQKYYVKKNIKNTGFVIDGRDIGSVVFKNANLKLYIEVNPKIRAKRRYKQLIDMGEKSIYRKILKEINLRDKKDKNRKNSPLIVPDGAHVITNEGNFRKTTEQIKPLMNNL